MPRKRGIGVRTQRELKDDANNYVDKEFERQKHAKVYSTAKIDYIMKNIDDPDKADMMPFFHGKSVWRNAGISFEYTKDEWEELQKCSEDPVYFVEKYCTFMTDYGRRTVTLRKYQREVLHMMGDEHYDQKLKLFIPDDRFIVLMQSRQTGKTTTTAAFFAWWLCFHTDKNAMVVANVERTSLEVFGKVQDVLKGLPFWLKPGVVSVSKNAMKFENGCSFRCVPTSDAPTTGDTLHLLMIDECALIPANKIDPFWRSVYPTLSSSNLSQIIVMSTPRGRHNLFYDLYSGAVNGTNNFKQKTVHYYEVPGHDTPEWKESVMKDFGETLFRQEFELSFDSDATKLVSASELKWMNDHKKEFKSVEIFGIPERVSSKIYWSPDFRPDRLTDEDLLRRRFLFQIDTAEGKEGGEKGSEDPDWNVINIYELEFLDPEIIERNRLGYKAVKMMDCVRYRQIGLYMDHEYDEESCAEAAQYLAFTLFRNGQGAYDGSEIDNVRINLEVNFNGVNWIKRFSSHDMYYSALILKTLHSQSAKEKRPGFKTVSGKHGKGYWCERGASLISRKQIVVTQDAEVSAMSTIQQLEAFGKNKSGVYEGSAMHDDIAVTVLFVSIAHENEGMLSWVDDWFSQLADADVPFEQKKLIATIGLMMDKYVAQGPMNEDEYTADDYAALYSSAASGFNGGGAAAALPASGYSPGAAYGGSVGQGLRSRSQQIYRQTVSGPAQNPMSGSRRPANPYLNRTGGGSFGKRLW